jgi:AAA+ superfamily predicted ATPase
MADEKKDTLKKEEKPATARTIFEKARAGYAALYLVSAEDMRSQKEIQSAAHELDRKLFTWTFGKGILEDGKKDPIADTELPPGLLNALTGVVDPKAKDKRYVIPSKSIVVLRLFHHFLDDPLVQSLLLDIIPEYKMTQRMLVVLTPVSKLPMELEKEFALVETQLPGEQQLHDVLNGIIEGSQLKGDMVPSEGRKEELIEAALGLTTSEAENALSLSLIRPRIAKSKDIWDPRIVMEEKCQALKKTGLLEYIPVSPSGLKDVGGLQNLKSWLSKRKNAFTQKAKDFGLPAPKGIILVGPPGCGKSLTAKAASSELAMPLLRLDMGKMFGSLVGQSEANIRNALQVAETISPCILWVDEIEKGTAGSGAGNLDSGVGARVMGTILTWMQEKKSPVFVFATANDVTGIPPELLRKGRFDEMFSVDLPNQAERKEILEIHIKKKNRGHLIMSGKIKLDHFAGETTEGFTGAEIEAAINDAMYAAFDGEKDLNDFDLQHSFDSTNPLSKTMKEKIDAIRRWCERRTRPANTPEVAVPPPSASGRSVQV